MKRQSQHGFTLLEVLLASSLSVLILLALGGAIQFYLFQVTESQTSIEQAQLARAVMRRMETDLRSAIWKNEIDFTSVEALAADSIASGAGDLAASAGLDPTLAEDALAGSNTQELATSSVLPTTIGLYGNAYELQIDISRIPRIDEYDPQYTSFRSREIGDIPSDIKTVTYFLMQPGVSSLGHGTVGDAGITETQFGLVRRELDRAVTQYALNNGDSTGLDASAEILAPEVSLLQFRYFDGYEWIEEWDSEAMGGLPMAVDVIIAIRDHDMTQALLADGAIEVPVADTTNPVGQVFRRLIRIPTAKPYEPEEEIDSTDTLSEDAAL
ncbi:prepilin-type N-terminal cleavage/methylation domain-containing protein [Bremerella sp. P1]|uniref:prepilin-type N-terminal cleavage/methylation domain-containing protein n=1 Tax=Bremerella sp. P1 TaxID=3026424 RepID=UPI0023682047|nr:prepilin-type N-terminal cleavage/methylation domain-containing protein [Bremerella sp. P1]WDI41204.1 prepilin-type N-terminal cleavage/methylation domain-containing protein [Bremerella sp. P1]